ncbi:MAG: DNA mismatch repair endonuclease MutL [Alphaproteobacteria bacterium]|nr:DNA mismatch repair endonuclease MutL [Alphaproteobacteria bacterium]
MKIKLLSDELINQIAAGEIVERPAAALKEVVENSIDAGARNVDVFVQNGGKRKIVVSDDGEGLDREDLLMAIQRHATSKLSGENLFDIRSYGFRGEAIPSIASVSEFSIESRGAGIAVDFSNRSDIFPSSVERGARVSIKNLFERTPARLKFLKSDAVELTHCIRVVENIALTSTFGKSVNFSLRTDERMIISFKNDTLAQRVAKIMGTEIFERAVHFEEQSEHISVQGYLFHPTDSRYSQAFQRIFINGRVVRDKTVSAALRNAYKELIPAGRFAIAVLFIDVDPFYIDVNVSPTKSEVRFRDTTFAQKFLTDAIKKNLVQFDRIAIGVGDISTMRLAVNSSSWQNCGINTEAPSVAVASGNTRCLPQEQVFSASAVDVLGRSFTTDPARMQNDASFVGAEEIFSPVVTGRGGEAPNFAFTKADNDAETGVDDGANTSQFSPKVWESSRDIGDVKAAEVVADSEGSRERFFGEPIAQIFDAYILTKTSRGLMIIDQHAVHEKITQDRMLKELTSENRQFLTTPETMELTSVELEVYKTVSQSLVNCGFSLELAQNLLLISAIPQILNIQQATEFIRDILSEQDAVNDIAILDKIRRKIADKACHNSIRFGRKLSREEMVAVLEQMEQVPSIHQCNHHRPSFVEISKAQLEKMFDRS